MFDEEIDMICVSMFVVEYVDDYIVMLIDVYFSGDSWLIWEFGCFDVYENFGMICVEVDYQMVQVQEKLMDQCNKVWIVFIEQVVVDVVVQGCDIVVGFGVLYFLGKNGVLVLLQCDGWMIMQVQLQGGVNGG